MSGKWLGAVLVLIAIAGGVYYMSMDGDMDLSALPGVPGSQSAGDRTGGTPVPSQSGSVDDFTASIDSEIRATSAGIDAMDAQTDASVSDIQSTGDSSRLYDPNNI